MFYDRKIKYVEVLDKGERLQTAGFVKLEAKGEQVCMQINLSGLRRTDAGECPVLLLGNGKEAELGRISVDAGKGRCEFAGLETEGLVEGISYGELEEVHIKLPRGVVLCCIIQQKKQTAKEQVEAEAIEPMQLAPKKEESMNTMQLQAEMMERNESVSQGKDEAITVWEQDAPGEKIVPVEAEKVERLSEPELMREAFMEEKRLVFSAAADKWLQLSEIYPHIRPFEDNREYLVVKPQDFVVLSQKSFELTSNSFLLHGYYNYEHLILCKEKKAEKECFYIGVPGNFYDKEKQVAVLFGFESFEGKREPAGCGDFGYYMVPVEI